MFNQIRATLVRGRGVCLLIITSNLLFLSSCSKFDKEQIAKNQAYHASADFKWETWKQKQVNITVNGAADGTPLDIYASDGSRLSRAIVYNGKASFRFSHSCASTNLEVRGPKGIKMSTIPGGNPSLNLNYVNNEEDETDTDGDGVYDSFDEFPLDPDRAYTILQPATGYIVYAFEDLWPTKGDFDMNDMGVASRTTLYVNSANKVVGGEEEIVVHTIGCGLPNGLMVQYIQHDETVGYKAINQDIIASYEGSWKTMSGATGYPVKDNAPNTVKVFDNIFTAQSKYYRNIGTWDPSNPLPISQVKPDTFRFRFTMTEPFSGSLMSDVFLIKGNTSINKGDRGSEIHVAGVPPTNQVNNALFGSEDDNSLEANWYLSKDNEPWAIKMWAPQAFDFHYPLYNVRMPQAYPYFSSWVNSNGSSYTDWYLNPDTTKTFNPAY